MMNVNERKKLLTQVAALEQDSVNYFDVEEEFFLIDSDNLSEVHTRLYGYSIQADGIYEDDNLTPEAVKGLDGRGCYVYVEARDGQITIRQDLNGSWGIYLFPTRRLLRAEQFVLPPARPRQIPLPADGEQRLLQLPDDEYSDKPRVFGYRRQ